MVDETSAGAESLPFARVYSDNNAFLWRSLRRLGVRDRDVEDVCQEAFLVVHKKLPQFRGGSIRAWLFAIAARVASDYRKRAHVRREVVAEDVPDTEVSETQTGLLDQAKARAVLDDILASLDDDKRAVFIAYELEELSITEICEALSCPAQTAYSRLHAAREHVAHGIERWQARDRVRS